ncbi:MAG: hypothetical protein HY590_06015 [Candidatus Omnitrophica bacterium]|nr:hypothetical protein [Candidatus Omnitrophota bacterium]
MITKSDLCRAWEEKIGYHFEKPTLLEQALTHRSYANERGLSSGNESLALLGDAILQFFVTTRLYAETPMQRPGFLTERRKSFVCEETLSEKAKRLGLGEAILFGRGESQQGGAFKASHLSETFEALIGAIFLDGGLTEAVQFLSSQFEELIG